MLEFRRDASASSTKVEQRIMTGAESSRPTNGRAAIAPIISVYGDEYNIKEQAVLPVRSFTPRLMRSDGVQLLALAATFELVALAPNPVDRPQGTFNGDVSAGIRPTQSHPFLEFDGEPPMRQPLDVGPAAGALQKLERPTFYEATIGL